MRQRVLLGATAVRFKDLRPADAVSLSLEDDAHAAIIGDAGLAEGEGLVNRAGDQGQRTVLELHTCDSLPGGPAGSERAILEQLRLRLLHQRVVIAGSPIEGGFLTGLVVLRLAEIRQ